MAMLVRRDIDGGEPVAGGWVWVNSNSRRTRTTDGPASQTAHQSRRVPLPVILWGGRQRPMKAGACQTKDGHGWLPVSCAPAKTAKGRHPSNKNNNGLALFARQRLPFFTAVSMATLSCNTAVGQWGHKPQPTAGILCFFLLTRDRQSAEVLFDMRELFFLFSLCFSWWKVSLNFFALKASFATFSIFQEKVN